MVLCSAVIIDIVQDLGLGGGPENPGMYEIGWINDACVLLIFCLWRQWWCLWFSLSGSCSICCVCAVQPVTAAVAAGKCAVLWWRWDFWHLLLRVSSTTPSSSLQLRLLPLGWPTSSLCDLLPAISISQGQSHEPASSQTSLKQRPGLPTGLVLRSCSL